MGKKKWNLQKKKTSNIFTEEILKIILKYKKN